MRLPRFRIRTLMIAVALLGVLLAMVPIGRKASDLNWMFVVGCGVIFVLIAIVSILTTVVFEALFDSSNQRPTE